MFRVWKQVSATVWQECRGYEGMWGGGLMDRLWNGDIVEYMPGQRWTMDVPEGHTSLPYEE